MLVDAEGSRHVAMHHRREFKPLATFMLVPIFSKPPTSDSNRYLQSNHKDQRHVTLFEPNESVVRSRLRRS